MLPAAGRMEFPTQLLQAGSRLPIAVEPLGTQIPDSENSAVAATESVREDAEPMPGISRAPGRAATSRLQNRR